jgi:arsenate reductase (thioredoxin)
MSFGLGVSRSGLAMKDSLDRAGTRKRVLFVCVENACRSQLAEAFAHIHGGGAIEAYSAGSRPSGQVNPQAIAAMRELDYDLSRHQSKSLAEIPDVEYDLAITMGCGDECPLVRARHREDWGIPDPKDMGPDEFRQVRDLIEAKVKALLAGLPAVKD